MKQRTLSIVLVVVLSLLLGTLPAAAQPVTVTWFVGLGTGTNDVQIAAQQAVVEAFNSSHDDIQIELILAANNQVAPDTLGTLIAGGTPPDIIGPVGFSGANLFSGQWLDLQPLVDASGYDLSVYPDSLVGLYQTSEGLVGIPFAVFPSLLFYNTDLFDEADLPYPPSDFGAPYVWDDGTESEWDWDTLAEIAKILTVDSNGNDATMDEFDPSSIEQYGFVNQWGSMRADLSTFGGAEFYNAETGEVTIPEHWREGAKWIWDGIWADHFIPTATVESSSLFAPTAIGSGRVAMARVPLWFTCCIGPAEGGTPINFDFAPVPAYNGTYSAPTDADTFRIHKSTDNPEAAFEVLTYLQGEAAEQLLIAYGALPALPDIQESYLAGQAERFESVQNWHLINESLAYAAVPNHESDNPLFARTQQRFADFRTLLLGDTGGEIDLDAELDKLEADLQAIIDEAN